MRTAKYLIFAVKTLLMAVLIITFSPYRIHAQQKDVFVSNAQINEPITSPRCNEFTFDATRSHDPDSENISFLWDLGDGTMSREPVVTHSYQISGDYDVTLTVNDNSGAENSTAVTSRIVRSNIPPFAVIISPEKICTDTPVNLSGADSYDDITKNLNYKWNFGDGTPSSNNMTVSKTYKNSGLYTLSLTVDDNSRTPCSSHTAEKFIYVNASPIAEAGKDEVLKCIQQGEEMIVSFDASQSSDPNGDPLMYRWDFGDGGSYDGIATSHQFYQPGIYDVQLVVSDSSNVGCSKSIDFVKVRLNVAPVANAGENIVACPGEIVDFDGSDSFIAQKGTVISKWFFGDGVIKPGIKVQHSYPKAGKYQASLTVQNELNSLCPSSRDTKLITVNSAPKVSIKSENVTCLGESVQFDASSALDPDGDALEYYWSFGDGAVLKAGAVVNHEYRLGGEYRVSVVVDDQAQTACSTATAEKLIRVNTPPIADPGPNLTCCVDLETTFSATASTDPDNDRLRYNWDLGDGTKMSGAVVNHKYKQSGSYNVTVTVDDNSGTACSSSSSGFVAQANATPIPKIDVR